MSARRRPSSLVSERRRSRRVAQLDRQEELRRRQPAGNLLSPTSVEGAEGVVEERHRRGRRYRGDRHRRRRGACRTSVSPRPTPARASIATAVDQPVRDPRRATSTATARTWPASSPATATTAPTQTRCTGRYIGVAPDADLVSVKISMTTRVTRPCSTSSTASSSSSTSRTSTTSASSTCRSSPPRLSRTRSTRWRGGRGGLVQRHRRGRGRGQPRLGQRTPSSYAPGNDPYVISVGASTTRAPSPAVDDALAELVEPRRHPGRLLQAGGRRTGRPHRVEPRARQRVRRHCVPPASSPGEYIRAGGTSMAAPMVAGAVANILQVHPEPDSDQVKGVRWTRDRVVARQHQRISLAGVSNESARTPPPTRASAPTS